MAPAEKSGIAAVSILPIFISLYLIPNFSPNVVNIFSPNVNASLVALVVTAAGRATTPKVPSKLASRLNLETINATKYVDISGVSLKVVTLRPVVDGTAGPSAGVFEIINS